MLVWRCNHAQSLLQGRRRCHHHPCPHHRQHAAAGTAPLPAHMQQPPIPAGAGPSLLPHPTRSASALHAKPLAAPSWETSSTADPSASLSLAPAFSATLRMLEWPRLCEYLAEYASTHAGRRECLELSVPSTAAESQRLLDETRSLLTLEYDYFTALDFGGISTAEAEAALKRAAKGGMCSPGELRGAASLFEGAAGLRRQITAAARANDALGTRDGPLAPLLRAVAALQPGAVFCREVRAAIDDEGRVADAASEALAGLRARVRAVQQRLNGVLRGLAGGVGGEVSDQAGRMCLAVTAGVKLPPGSILLGSSTGGSILYVEPSAAVALNNELGGAKAQAASAEEDVLYALTGRLMGVLEEAQLCLQVVTWLDVLSAKARFGIWMGAKLPELVPWEQVFHARGAAARRAQQKLQQHNGGSNGKVDPADDPDARFMVRLRSLRHPLLYCAYLKQRQVLERQAQMEGSATAGGAGGTARRGRMRLSNRKEAMMNDLGLKAPGSDGQPSEGALSAQAQLSALRAPRPIDVLVRCETSAVVVTGPNTGGKTAAMKALGLTALMARAGLAVPAEEPARLPAFSSVLADIGDEQSLTANLSTFSGHLRRIQALRAEADGKALILLDELGTGTDPTEGAALGVALLRRLVNGGIGGGALTMATTHHSIMTGLKFEDPRFENACVEFDEEALAPTYKLLWGIPGRSNALNIASRLGLDPDLIEAARRLLDTSTTAADAAIAELEALQSQAERDEMAAWTQEQEVKRLEREVEKHEQRVDAKREELGTARRNSLFGVWQRAQDRLKAVKSLMKKYKQGALPPGVTVPSLLLEQQAGGGGGGSENGKLKTVEEVWNEVDRLAGKGQAAGRVGEEGGQEEGGGG